MLVIVLLSFGIGVGIVLLSIGIGIVLLSIGIGIGIALLSIGTKSMSSTVHSYIRNVHRSAYRTKLLNIS